MGISPVLNLMSGPSLLKREPLLQLFLNPGFSTAVERSFSQKKIPGVDIYHPDQILWLARKYLIDDGLE